MAKTYGDLYPGGQGWDDGNWGEKTGGRKYIAGPNGKGAYLEDKGPAPGFEHLAEDPDVQRFSPTGKEKSKEPKRGRGR